MKDKLQQLKSKPGVAHVLRMAARYKNRLGNQFAGAITYFSVLALVPILMFAFAILGMTVTTLLPQMLGQIKGAVADAMQGAPGNTKDQILGVVNDALTNWVGIGIFGLLSALYAGAGWVANMKSAVRAQIRTELEAEEDKSNIVVETLKNMGTLIMLLLMVAITFAISTVATALSDTIISALHLETIPGVKLILRLVSPLVSLLAGWLLFLFLFRVLPENRIRTRELVRGALIGAVGLVVLQYLSGILMGSFSGNPAAALFGPIIIIMLFFNLFARVILYVSAWIATATQPAVARKHSEADEPLRHQEDVETVENHWEEAEEDRRRQDAKKAEAEEQRKEMIAKVKDKVPGVDSEE